MLQKARKIVAETEHIQEVLNKHIREFRDPGALHCLDSNLDQPETWDKADLKVLLVFVSTIQSRSVASTDNVLVNLIKTAFLDQVFVDVCNLPEKENMELFDQYQLPIIFGTVTHRSWKDFDVIFISNSTVEEKMNIPFVLHHSGIPIWYTQRIDNPDIPLVLLGGNSSDMSDVLLGYSDDGKDYSIIDGTFIGYAEGMIDKILEIISMYKPSGKIRTDKRSVLTALFEVKSFLHPDQFGYIYDEKIPWHIKKVFKNPMCEGANDVVEFNRPEDIDAYPGFERKILHPIQDANYRSADIQISWGCSSGGACTFCKENYVAGGWREKSLEKIRKELQECRMWSMADWVSFFSFNTNYYANYLKMMKEATQIFPHLSFIAMRADVVGARPDYFRFNSKLGQRRISFGVEGVSDRIRNGYLNKSLSWDELMKACESCFENRFMEIKFCMINTGIETEEDFDEMVEFLRKAFVKRDEMGANTTFRLSFTNLCYYPETPLQWEYRLTVEQSLERERKRAEGTLRREDGRLAKFIDKLRTLQGGVRMDLANMTGLKFIYPQLMLDLNRKMTAILVKSSIDKGIVYFRNIKNEEIQWLISEIESRGYMIKDILAERPADFIFSGSYIKTLDPKYIARARKMALEFKPNPMCLATVAKPTDRKCVACGYCTTSEMREARTHRVFDTTTTVDEVLENVSMNRPKYRLLVKVVRNQELSYLNPLSTWNHLWSSMMRSGGWEMAKKVYSVHECYERFIHREKAADYTAGIVLCEVLMKEEIPIEVIREAYEKVKTGSKSLAFVDAKYIPLEGDYKSNTHQMVVLSSYLQDFGLRDRLMGFDGSVKIIDKCMGNKDPKFVVQKLDLQEPLFYEGTVQTGTFMIVSFPFNVNPFAYLSSVTGKSFDQCLREYKAYRVMYFKQGMSSCKKCGARSFIDLFEGRDSSFCELCARKAIVTKMKAR